jgi:A/G-specific adenine glycosylase
MFNIMTEIIRLTAKQFSQRLLSWFDAEGRTDLPWQHNKTPYRVWVSEIMLQQTQVSTVIPYFNRFMQQFPTITTLAEAKEDTVLHLWTGLGYYNRARNLQKTAKIIVTEYDSQFPTELNELIKLPGVGRSTAGAILSIAFNKPTAILDGNVKRVLTRLHGITGWSGKKEITEQLWTLAEQYTPKNRIADYTQAIMDLGATLCVRSKPRCTECPLQKYCSAYAQGIENMVPVAKPKKTIPIRQATLLILQKNNHFIFLEKRPPTGVWASLWSLPEIKGAPSSAEIKKFCKQRFQFQLDKLVHGDSFRHTFSHFHLDITPIWARVKATPSKIMEEGHQIWYNLQQSQEIGLPAPVKLLLEKTS